MTYEIASAILIAAEGLACTRRISDASSFTMEWMCLLRLGEIHWSRKTGRKTSYNPRMDEHRAAAPNCCNRDSKLQVNLKPGKNEARF